MKPKYCRVCGEKKCAGHPVHWATEYCEFCGKKLIPTSVRYCICPNKCGPLYQRQNADIEDQEYEDAEFKRRLDAVDFKEKAK